MAREKKPAPPASGPAADYPIVLGAPFTIDGVTYTPADTLNYDQVGYALVDPGLGQGISIAHRTLPLPCYVEITALRTGRTILVRVERRGPMTGTALISLSPAAASQLGASDPRTPIRIRRVNPPEPERALLRAGQPAPLRMDTPLSLAGVLMRRLDSGSALPPPGYAAPKAAMAPAPAVPASQAPAGPPATSWARHPAPTSPQRRTVPPVEQPDPAPAETASRSRPAATIDRTGRAMVVQVGAYSSRATAAAVAARVGGAVSPTGRLFRVRIGGFSTSAEAGAALAKARAAGYSEARIQHAD